MSTTLVLPKSLQRQEKVTPKPILGQFTHEQIFKDCTVNAGRVMVCKCFNGGIMAGNGIELPSVGPETQGTRDKLSYGKVAACGMWADRQGKPYESVPGWGPDGNGLEPGTYIEFYRPYPDQGIDSFDAIGCDDIRRIWKKDCPPPWWPNEKK